jgi:hypothetical protein
MRWPSEDSIQPRALANVVARIIKSSLRPIHPSFLKIAAVVG